jgi:surface antigen
MAPRGKLFVISVAALLLAHEASAAGSWESARYWSGFGYSGISVLGQESGWSSDFGIVAGRCNASLVSTFVDDTPDGDRDHTRSVATLHGPIMSDTPSLDAIDRGCMGHALELAPSFFAVRWTNPRTHGTYLLTPMRRLNLHGNQCRVFSAQMTLDGESTPLRGTACRHGRGDWQMI